MFYSEWIEVTHFWHDVLNLAILTSAHQGERDVKVDLDQSVKMVPAGFHLCKVILFPFVINKNLGRDGFRLYKYPFSPQTFVH